MPLTLEEIRQREKQNLTETKDTWQKLAYLRYELKSIRKGIREYEPEKEGFAAVI
jgi:hypothetical protein